MSKRSIADFFKPYANPWHSPHSPDHDGPNPRPAQRSRSNTPCATTPSIAEEAGGPDTTNALPLTSSQSSRLSSLQNSISSAPEEPFDLPPDLPPAHLDKSATVQSYGDDITGSQGAIIHSSQRIIRNGEVIIKDSDDDRSDSDVSLEDLEDLIAPRKSPPRSSPLSPYELPLPRPLLSGRSANTRTEAKKSKRTSGFSSTETKLPTYKFSLAALIKQSENEENSRTSLRDARRLLESLDEQQPLAGTETTVGLDEDLLASVIRNDGDQTDVGRLMAAIKRTEALHQEEAWSFFDENHELMDLEPPDFPSVDDPDWQRICEDPLGRQQAFLSGYVGECASLRKLPDELLVWLLDAASHEERNDLRFSYCQTLRDLGDPITSCLSPSKLNELFESIGARPEALDLGKTVALSLATSRSSRAGAYVRLRHILDICLAVATSMDLQLRRHTICILCRLMLDRDIVLDHNVLPIIQDVIGMVLDSIEGDADADEETTSILALIYPSVQDSGLQLQLLQNLPSSSSRQSLIRRRLALAFFFQDPISLSMKREELLDMKAVIQHLSKPRFIVNMDTDYASLAASIAILAIGLDNGDPPSIDASEVAVSTFNGDLDRLAQKIKGMFTQIVDTGAAHMQRTKAKEILESFHACLVYAVRTKQKPKGMMWGDDVVDEKQRSVMKNFVQRQAHQ